MVRCLVKSNSTSKDPIPKPPFALILGIAVVAIAAGCALSLYHHEVVIGLMTLVVQPKHLHVALWSPQAVAYVPLKLFLVGVIAFATPLVVAWLETPNCRKYIITAAAFLTLSSTLSFAGILAYRWYMQTEINDVHIGSAVYPSLTRGDLTPLDNVPIVWLSLLGPYLVLAAVAFRRRAALFRQQ